MMGSTSAVQACSTIARDQPEPVTTISSVIKESFIPSLKRRFLLPRPRVEDGSTGEENDKKRLRLSFYFEDSRDHSYLCILGAWRAGWLTL